MPSPADQALAYLARRDALHKLAVPVSCLYSCPRQCMAIRQHREALAAVYARRRGWPWCARWVAGLFNS